jgi:transcriptional regulator with XRE-family HTH domain
VITAAHVRMARAGLRWSLIELANRAGINPNTINRFENGKGINSKKLALIESAFRSAGVVFEDENDSVGVTLAKGQDGELRTRTERPQRKISGKPDRARPAMTRSRKSR